MTAPRYTRCTEARRHRYEGVRIIASDFGLPRSASELAFAFLPPEYGNRTFGSLFQREVGGGPDARGLRQYRRIRVRNRRAWAVRIHEDYGSEVRFVNAVVSAALHPGEAVWEIYEDYRNRRCRFPDLLRPADFLAYVARFLGAAQIEVCVRRVLGVVSTCSGPLAGVIFASSGYLDLSPKTIYDTASVYQVHAKTIHDASGLYSALVGRRW